MGDVVVPFDPGFGPLKKHAEFHTRRFRENRRSLVSQLRCVSGLPDVVASLGQETLYKLVLPDGKLLQRAKDGLFTGVFYGNKGIEKHARFSAVGPNVVNAAKAVGAQILLISIVMQLDNIENMIEGLYLEMHRDRIARLMGGVDEFEIAMVVDDPAHRERTLSNAATKLHGAIRETLASLRDRIAEAPNPDNNILDHFRLLVRRKSRTGEAAIKMGLAQDAFQASLLGISTLSQCYAALGEQRAATKTLSHYLDVLLACRIDLAAEKARLVEVDHGLPAETPWKRFLESEPQLRKQLAGLSSCDVDAPNSRLEIEFMSTELQGAAHADLP